MPSLTWLTRDEDLKRAGNVPYRLLEEAPELSFGDANNSNLLIQGDNLDALKALLPYYKGRVKCVYIDPPFGTGREFENYDDNYKHAIWLAMIYPRLDILRDLLANEGAIFMHLDDNEADYAKVVMDEIFGRSNFVSRLAIRARSPSAFSTVNPGVFKSSEYILWYAKSKSDMPQQRVWTSREPDLAYKKWIVNPEAKPSEWIIESATERLNKFLKEGAGRLTPSKALKKFYIDNCKNLMRLAEISDSGAGEDIVQLKRVSAQNSGRIYTLKRDDYDDVHILDGQQILSYEKNIQEIDGELTPARMLTNIWDDISWEGIAKEGGVKLKKGKKPERLIRRCFQLVTKPGDLVLDSFLGSGTTAAVAHKMGRKWIGLELGEQAKTHCAKRLQSVVAGEQSGISRLEGWKGGGGFRFYRLGEPVFDDQGRIRAGIKFPALAAHVWFSETGLPYAGAADSPFLGNHFGRGFALLYNGILGDKSVTGGNVLTGALLASIRKLAGHDGPLTIYGEASRIGAARLKSEGVTFKQTPYDVKAR